MFYILQSSYQIKKFVTYFLLGIGDTVEEAEKIAALNVLMKMFGLRDFSKPIRCNLKIDESESSNLPLEEWSRSNV